MKKIFVYSIVLGLFIVLIYVICAIYISILGIGGVIVIFPLCLFIAELIMLKMILKDDKLDYSSGFLINIFSCLFLLLLAILYFIYTHYDLKYYKYPFISKRDIFRFFLLFIFFSFYLNLIWAIFYITKKSKS